MRYFLLERLGHARDLRLARCRCGCDYPAPWDAEGSWCPRCGRFNVHALLPGWRRQPNRS